MIPLYQLKVLLADQKIEEALNSLKAYLENDQEKFNQWINFASRYRNLEHKRRLALARSEDIEIETNRIISAILELIDEIKRDQREDQSSKVKFHGVLASHSKEITSDKDPLLFPNMGIFLGRVPELNKLITYLNSESSSWGTVFGTVTGSGGIGKTELCKAALRQWIIANERRKIYFVDLTNATNADELVYFIGLSLGIPQITTIDEVFENLETQDTVLYLDNLETIIDDPRSLEYFKILRNKPGIKILASSRRRIRNLGFELPIDSLDDESAISLFIKTWTDSGGLPIINSDVLNEFVGTSTALSENYKYLDQSLGCHPLSIVLVASHGHQWTLEDLIDRWKEEGVNLAQSNEFSKNKIDSLDISISLTLNEISNKENAVFLWNVAAYCPEGISRHHISYLIHSFGNTIRTAVESLINYNVFSFVEQRYKLLPPLVRYGIQKSESNSKGFSNLRIVETLSEYYQQISASAANNLLTDQHSHTLQILLEDFSGIHRFASLLIKNKEVIDLRIPATNIANNLFYFYNYNISSSYDILNSLLKYSAAMKIDSPRHNAILHISLGNINHHLQLIQEARYHYNEALRLFDEIKDQYYLAVTLIKIAYIDQLSYDYKKAKEGYLAALKLLAEVEKNEYVELWQNMATMNLAEIKVWERNTESVREDLLEVKKNFEKINFQLGVAHVFKIFGDLEFRHGDYEVAREHYLKANNYYDLELYARGISNTLFSLGHVEAKLQSIESAKIHFLRAVEIWKSRKNDFERANSLLNLAQFDWIVGDVQPAIDHFTNALEIYSNSRYSHLQGHIGHCHLMLGGLNFQIGHMSATLEHYQKAHDFFEKVEDYRSIMHVFFSLCEVAFRQSDRARCLEYLEPVRLQLLGTKDYFGIQRYYNTNGTIEYHFGPIASADFFLRLAINLYENFGGDLFAYETSKVFLADIQRRFGNTEYAENVYQNAYKMAKNENNPHYVSFVRTFHGDLYFYERNFSLAKKYYDEALDNSFLCNESQGTANLKRRIADLAILRGDTQNEFILNLLDEAYAHYKNVGEVLGMADIIKSQADWEAKFGTKTKARDLYDQAIKEFQAVNSEQRLSQTLNNRAILEFQDNNLEHAYELFVQAEAYFAAQWEAKFVLEVKQNRARIHKKRGQNNDYRTSLEEAKNFARQFNFPFDLDH